MNESEVIDGLRNAILFLEENISAIRDEKLQLQAEIKVIQNKIDDIEEENRNLIKYLNIANIDNIFLRTRLLDLENHSIWSNIKRLFKNIF